MKVFIAGDTEGVAGIYRWDQVSGGRAFYEEGRRLHTEEIDGALVDRLAPALSLKSFV